jgi:hypothetical protein
MGSSLFDFPDGPDDIGGALEDLLPAAVEDHGGGVERTLSS